MMENKPAFRLQNLALNADGGQPSGNVNDIQGEAG